MKTNYNALTSDFLKKTNTTIEIYFIGFFINFDWQETETRPIFKIKLSNPKHSYIFKFYDSFANKEKMLDDPSFSHKNFKNYSPSNYNILACLVYCDYDNFKDFCLEFGYSNDSFKAYNIYTKTIEQNTNLKHLFTSKQLELLQFINKATNKKL